MEVSTAVEPLVLLSRSYQLDLDCPIAWPASTNDPMFSDYPFLIEPKQTEEENPSDFIIRRYLETVWLPESLMPLSHFIHSLRRVALAEKDSYSHPLVPLISTILLTLENIENKYRLELPQILQDGGGEGEVEETMMWFTWNHEKPHDGMDEEKWIKRWLDRLEKRETQTQVLLHFFILTLPQSNNTTKKKRKRKSKSKPHDAELDAEASLEILTDRLAVWQELGSLDADTQPSSKDGTERDWVQIFCEEVVAPLFKDLLPSQYANFHASLFPTRLRSPSPPLPQRSHSPPHPPLRQTTLPFAPPPVPPRRSVSIEPPRRSKSRSVSVSLEESSQNRGGVVNSKRLFVGKEVSMKRAASTKDIKFSKEGTAKSIAPGPRAGIARTISAPLRSKQPVTLVAATPVRPIAARNHFQIMYESPDQMNLLEEERAIGRVLVAETPAKP